MSNFAYVVTGIFFGQPGEILLSIGSLGFGISTSCSSLQERSSGWIITQIKAALS